MNKFTAYLLLFAMLLPLLAGVYWIIWQLWMLVMNGFGAPDKIANPSYWLFVLAMILLNILFGAVRK